MPIVEISTPGDGRTDHAGQIERAGAQRDGVEQVLPRDDVGDQCLPGRHLEGAQRAEEDGQAHDPVHGDQVEQDQDAEGERPR